MKVTAQSTVVTSARNLILVLVCAIFLGETLSHMLTYWLSPLPPLAQALLDSSLLAMIALPTFYYFLLRPVTAHIAERKREELELREANLRLTHLINTSSTLLFSMRVSGKQLQTEWVSDNLYSVLGYSREEALHPDWWHHHLHPKDVERVVLATARLFNGLPVAVDYRFMHKDGHEIWVHDEQKLVVDEQGEPVEVVSSWADITARKTAEEEIRKLAFYDTLTQLPNRRLMSDRMLQMLSHSRRTGELVAVCMLDLDGFKQVNDTLGHEGGDALLREVAQRLRECIRREDTAARFGGDEFALLLGGFKRTQECEQMLARIVAAVAAPYQVCGKIARVSASIGVTLFPNDGSDPDLLLRHADHAMYEAKQAGKNRYQLFDPRHEQIQQANQGMMDKIAYALANHQLELFYQPKVNCRKGTVVGAEALVRWHHPVLGLVSPAEFLPLIERDDLIVALGEWVIQNALQQLSVWRSAGLDIKVSVNIAARQLHQKEFPQRLKQLVAGYEAKVVSRLEIEIVESAALEDMVTVSAAIRECRATGVRVSLDDFGTGFSSLAHLKRFVVDELKIDRSFIANMLHDPGSLAIVEGVIGLAASFRHQVIAEGVEQVDQILLLMELGCDVMQGYGIAHPMPAERFPAWCTGFVPDPLWKLSSSPGYSRDYFNLLLAEANHHYWINQAITSSKDTHGDAGMDELLDHRQCPFGQWYYRGGIRRFRDVSEFRALETVHRNMHQIAARLSEHYRTGNQFKAAADEAEFLMRQNEMTGLLRRLREMLAEEMFGKKPITP